MFQAVTHLDFIVLVRGISFLADHAPPLYGKLLNPHLTDAITIEVITFFFKWGIPKVLTNLSKYVK